MATIKKIKDSAGVEHDIIDTKNTAGVTAAPTNDRKANFYLVGTKATDASYAQTYVNNSVYVDIINGNIFYVPNIRTSGNVLCDGSITASTIQTLGGIACGSISSDEILADRILNTIKIADEATETDIITLGELDSSSGKYVGNIKTNGIITAPAFYESSDERLKTFTEDYNINLDDIKNIKTGRFYWNSDENQVINGGVSAQTVETYFPELVRENENGIKSVNYDGLAVVAIAAIKKLTERIEELENIVYNK